MTRHLLCVDCGQRIPEPTEDPFRCPSCRDESPQPARHALEPRRFSEQGGSGDLHAGHLGVEAQAQRVMAEALTQVLTGRPGPLGAKPIDPRRRLREGC